jgi:hypothetical protein
MDEMTLLEDFRAVVAPPSEAVLAQARAAMTDGALVRDHPGQRRLHWPRTRGKLALTGLAGLAAATTAAAVAVALTAAPGGEPSPAGTVSPVVREMAYRVAAAAAAGSAVAPGQWVYWQEKTPDHTYEIWTTADGTRAAYVYQGKVAFVPCIGPHGERADSCQYIGQPDVAPVKAGGIGIGALTGTMPVPYAGLSSLPKDPVALDQYLAGLPLRGWGPAPVREFEVIKDLLITYVMPPALTAELYRALGNIPGVTIDRHAVDLAGRHGIGFKIALPAEQGGGFDELILDQETFAVMGQQLIPGPAAGAKAGQVIGGVAILKTALVSGPGILP